jgi:hypothetical protein
MPAPKAPKRDHGMPMGTGICEREPERARKEKVSLNELLNTRVEAGKGPQARDIVRVPQIAAIHQLPVLRYPMLVSE